nr:Uncharacterised protein [Raoultella sp. NCTC 9187]
MDNRTAFLNTIAQALGRPLRFEPQADAAPVNNYANERLTELSPQQRCDAFIQFASEVMLARWRTDQRGPGRRRGAAPVRRIGSAAGGAERRQPAGGAGYHRTLAAGMQRRGLGPSAR